MKNLGRSRMLLLLALAPVACGGDDTAVSPSTSGDGGPTTGSDGGGSDATVGDGGGTTADGAHPDAAPPNGAACRGTTASPATPATNLPSPPAVTVPGGFALETLASVGSARELAALPNGDLLVATNGNSVFLVPNAEGTGPAGSAVKFADLPDSPAQGITFVGATCTIYVATQHGIYSFAYADGQTTGTVKDPIAHVRTGDVAPNSDGDVHTTSSVVFSNGTLYAGVGSSCNACTEADPTRATIQAMSPDGSNMTTRATRFRNAIAMATNPDTGTVWSGGAGQDNLPIGHPYEFFDAVTSHPGTADYGWPECEENHTAYKQSADCSGTVAPLIEFPSYSTLIGAVFYPSSPTGAHAFPAEYRGSLFLAGHGSWHTTGNTYYSPPRVAFVPMNGDAPKTPVDWNDPTKQWTEFVSGFQLADGVTRIGRPTGIAVGKEGSLFVSDDQTGLVYRIRPQ